MSAATPAPERTRPRWETPAFIALLVATAAAYIYNLDASGWANSFYSAAVQAGSENWEAFLFGSSDMGNSITVDKPPAFLWLMALSVRLFGLNSWAMLVPQALLGVATVAVLYRSVRRACTPLAALLAGTALATTPVAALMFRYNNPDALLVLLLTIAAASVLRGIEDGRVRWMALAGVALGFAFLTKQLQALVIVPGLAVVYLCAADAPLKRRLRNALVTLGAFVVSAGWWVALVELVPADWRPYIGGSQNNSFLELTFGYNGLGRITGEETGAVGAGQWGATGLTRLFDGEYGGQAAWLLPAALIFAVVLIVRTWRRPRTDALRAQTLVWGSWLVVTGLVFSFMSGIFHAYYTVALAPAIAALVGIGVGELWARRHAADLVVLGVTTAMTGAWGGVLLLRTSSVLAWPVLVIGVLAGLALALSPWLADYRQQIAVWAALSGIAAGLAGPVSYTAITLQDAHTGSIVTAGPSLTGSSSMLSPGSGRLPSSMNSRSRGGESERSTDSQRGNGLLSGMTASDKLVDLLRNSGDVRWAAAVTGSQNAASLQLASNASVMPIGGFNASDSSPTLEQFEAYVAAGEIRYYVLGSIIGRSNGGSDAATAIAEWVEAHFTATTVAGTTVYDLSSGASDDAQQ